MGARTVELTARHGALGEMHVETMTFKVDARTLARGWLAVALAASDDDARPALYRTVHLECFGEGVRLLATDSYMLLRSWIRTSGDDLSAAPELDEVPPVTATAIDEHHRATALMKHLLSVTGGKDARQFDVVLSVGDCPLGDDVPTLDGLERRWVSIAVPDQEVLTLLAYEGEWPTWRALWAGFKPQQTDAIAFNPDLIVARLGKLGKLYPETPLVWTFGGPDAPARIELQHSDPPLLGLVMPLKVALPTLEGDDEQGGS